MHSRMEPRNWGTRPMHHEAQLDLSRMITELEITVEAGEKIGAAQRQNVISTISRWRDSIQQCVADFDEGEIKYVRPVAPPHLSNHWDVVEWLNNLSIDLKLAEFDPEQMKERDRPEPITLERLKEGWRLIQQLDNCRERLVFYR